MATRGPGQSLMRRSKPSPRPPARRARAGWVPADDAEQYASAAMLNDHLRLWWVYWSPHQRRYWAFYLGPERVAPVVAPDLRALYERACAEQRRVQARPT